MRNRMKSLIAGMVLRLVVLLATSQAVFAKSDNAVITEFAKDAAGAVIAGANYEWVN